MANFPTKISIISLILTLFLNIGFALSNENLKEGIAQGDWEKIYNSIEEADFEYIFNLDPYQPDEYTKYMYSPYPLFRSGVTLVFKSKIIPPGYYLLTPREKDNKIYVLFKEQGKVTYLIPVYKTGIVAENFYEEKIPHKQLTKPQSLSKKAMDFIGVHWGKKNQRTPIPQAYIDFDDAGEFWNMVLYYGNKKYYLIFKKG